MKHEALFIYLENIEDFLQLSRPQTYITVVRLQTKDGSHQFAVVLGGFAFDTGSAIQYAAPVPPSENAEAVISELIRDISEKVKNKTGKAPMRGIIRSNIQLGQPFRK